MHESEFIITEYEQKKYQKETKVVVILEYLQICHVNSLLAKICTFKHLRFKLLKADDGGSATDFESLFLFLCNLTRIQSHTGLSVHAA